MKKVFALLIATLALVAGSLTLKAMPAEATVPPGVAFSPTTNLVPGTMLTNLVVTRVGDFMCESVVGTEITAGTTVQYGVMFFETTNTITNPTTDRNLGSTGIQRPYVAGSSVSIPSSVQMPVLAWKNPDANIVGIGYCMDGSTNRYRFHGTGVVVTYSDLTFAASGVPGSPATAHILDGTSSSQFCLSATTSNPYSVQLLFYADYDSAVSGTPVFQYPTSWTAGSGPALGSFNKSDLSSGIDIQFTVPAGTPYGNYLAMARCVDSAGNYSLNRLKMGGSWFTVAATSGSTGGSTGGSSGSSTGSTTGGSSGSTTVNTSGGSLADGSAANVSASLPVTGVTQAPFVALGTIAALFITVGITSIIVRRRRRAL